MKKTTTTQELGGFTGFHFFFHLVPQASHYTLSSVPNPPVSRHRQSIPFLSSLPPHCTTSVFGNRGFWFRSGIFSNHAPPKSNESNSFMNVPKPPGIDGREENGREWRLTGLQSSILVLKSPSLKPLADWTAPWHWSPF